MGGAWKESTRRGFLGVAGWIAPSSAVAEGLFPQIHAAGSDTIRVALVGCGGRGTGAAVNALSVESGPIKLVAMADVFEARVARSYRALRDHLSGGSGGGEPPAFEASQIDVPKDRRFVGLASHKDAMDCLRPGDLVILASPPAFRWPHFAYAVAKGVNVFMEKAVTVDGPTTRRLLRLAEVSEARNLKVGVGLMCRHCVARQALYERIREGRIGDVVGLRAYRMHGVVGHPFSPPPPPSANELLYQIERFHSFLWASGGLYSDFYIHNIDECCWMKDAWPVRAQGMGGRHNRGENVDQNFDSYSVEYTFADDSTLLVKGRSIEGCHDEFASYAHGTKGSAIISTSAHTPALCRIYGTQDLGNDSDLVWGFPQPEPNPYQLEFDHLIDAIRRDKPFNEAKRGAEASLVASLGRMAAHTGRLVTYDEILNSDHEFAPDLDRLTEDSPAPVRADASGRYPVPEPGVKRREY
jgi:predicted dehydrogenase